MMSWLIVSSLAAAAYVYWIYPIRWARAVETLWSKGVALRCNTRWSEDYWRRATEERAEPHFFEQAMDGCEGLVYVRLGTSNDRPLDVETFSRSLDRLTKPIVLLTTDGDSSVPGDVSEEAVTAILEHPLVLAWYTQNWDGTAHPKLKPFPIGLDLHSRRINFLPKGYPVELCLRAIARTARPLLQRRRAIFCDFHHTAREVHNGERYRFREILQDCPHVDFLHQRVPQLELWRRYAGYVFVASTHGNGLDCHRTWEALLLGCIVVTKRSSLDPLYRGLPVVIVEDWAECKDPANLERWLQEHQPRSRDMWSKLRAERWVKDLRARLISKP